MTAAAQAPGAIAFGPFRLSAKERLLTREGVPVKLGGRALDLLVTLASRPNEIVSKRELLAEVWPDVTVDEGSLRFHMAALRKALGDGQDGARYIATLAGRGYSFVAPTSTATERPLPLACSNLPGRLMRMVGRGEDVRQVAAELEATRFVTIVGPGGVGKTTVAVAVAHEVLAGFAGAVLFVDLSGVSHPDVLPILIASMLGLSVQSDDVARSVVTYLSGRRVLLILDSSEPLIDAVAALATRIFAASPEVHILATSREALRVEGEHVFRLETLPCPPDEPGLTVAQVRDYPAARLFLERAAASGARLKLTDADADVVARICRRLDGLPLAIELAAVWVEAYGLHQTEALLDDHLSQLGLGRRTAPPRQQTLQATLDWSYALLTEAERIVLRRLAVFVGVFSLEAALAVVASRQIDRAGAFQAIDNLVAKSMVGPHRFGEALCYRLLDATRAYLLDLPVDPEAPDLAARHAVYYRDWLEHTRDDWPALATSNDRAPTLAALGNVRAALAWCFGANGELAPGVMLAAAAAPAFIAMSLLIESRRWSQQALRALDGAARGGEDEMRLQAALAMSLMFTSGASDAALAALERSLAIAEERGDGRNQLMLIGSRFMFHVRRGEFRDALSDARRAASLDAADGPEAAALGRALLGISLHFSGDLGGARAELETALALDADLAHAGTLSLGFDHRGLAASALARTLWLQGYPAQATAKARRTVRKAEQMGHPLALTAALYWAVSIFEWVGDLASADAYVERFIAHAQAHSLAPYVAIGDALRAELAIRRGDAEVGVARLRKRLETLEVARFGLLRTPFTLSLVEGLAATGRVSEAHARIDEAIQRVEARGDLVYMPELLRVKADLFLAAPQPRREEAEAQLRESLDLSRRQGARSWELRATLDLAGLWETEGQDERARDLVHPVLCRFAEGSHTADLRAANRLLARLG